MGRREEVDRRAGVDDHGPILSAADCNGPGLRLQDSVAENGSAFLYPDHHAVEPDLVCNCRGVNPDPAGFQGQPDEVC